MSDITNRLHEVLTDVLYGTRHVNLVRAAETEALKAELLEALTPLLRSEPLRGREVSTIAELDALPIGSVVCDGDAAAASTAYQVELDSFGKRHWYEAGREWAYGPEAIYLPATVLYEPTEETP